MNAAEVICGVMLMWAAAMYVVYQALVALFRRW